MPTTDHMPGQALGAAHVGVNDSPAFSQGRTPLRAPTRSRHMKIRNVPPLLDTVRARARSCASQSFQIEGMQVELRALDPASINWVLKSMQPLSLIPAHGAQKKYTVTCLYSDDIVLDTIRNLNDIDIVCIRRHGKSSFVRLSRPSVDTVLYCDPDEGVLWLSDLADNTVYLVVSSRTRHAAHAFASITREVVTQHLAAQGWTLFHAGAVHTKNGTVMVVGNSGAGKTSLLLALLRGGTRFIANELLYVRCAADGLRVLGFPMPIAVGLGTAMQFAPLAALITSPGGLEFPRNRLSLARVVNTSQSEWPQLEDKLQLMPGELCDLLGAPPPLAGGTLVAVVVPSVALEGVAHSLERLSSMQIGKILSTNHTGLTKDSSYPPWLELNLPRATKKGHKRMMASLAELNPLRFQFCLSLDTVEHYYTYTDSLLKAQRQLPHGS